MIQVSYNYCKYNYTCSVSKVILAVSKVILAASKVNLVLVNHKSFFYEFSLYHKTDLVLI